MKYRFNVVTAGSTVDKVYPVNISNTGPLNMNCPICHYPSVMDGIIKGKVLVEQNVLGITATHIDCKEHLDELL